MQAAKSVPDSSTSINLFAISLLGLFFELLIIRWLSSEIRIIAYFTNMTLMSAILGLGLGSLSYSSFKFNPNIFLYLLFFLFYTVFLYQGGFIEIPLYHSNHFMWNGLSRFASQNTYFQYVGLILFFLLNTCLFIPLGQLTGEYFDKLPPLKAYGINLLGALSGILLFTLLGSLRLSPVWWFMLGTIIYLFIIKAELKKISMSVILIMGTCLTFLTLDPSSTQWSPYYKIKTTSITLNNEPLNEAGFSVIVNGDSHMQTLDLSGKFDHINEIKQRREIYDEPYHYGKSQKVLIIGAGTGNDVAAALRAGAGSVDAVEIDPVIISLGKQHPEKPYDNKKVSLINKDARSFVQQSSKQYDKIVIGYLDSHTLFSSMSSVRLDNFIYTKEFFHILKSHLSSDGSLSMTFTIHEAWIADRLYHLMADTFGQQPIIYQGGAQSSKGTVFTVNYAQQTPKIHYSSFNPIEKKGSKFSWNYDTQGGYLDPNVFSTTTDIPTDDWPYLYLKEKNIPLNYIIPLAVIFILSIFIVARVNSNQGNIEPVFFLLGAGFMLLETKAITELSLFLGSTWFASAMIISMILLLIYLANKLITNYSNLSLQKLYLVLGCSIVVSYVIPLNQLLLWPYVLGVIIAGFTLCAPLFFAGLIFSTHIKDHHHAAKALGSNLMGAMLGGTLEYASLIYGFKTLYLIALLIYALAYLASASSHILKLKTAKI